MEDIKHPLEKSLKPGVVEQLKSAQAHITQLKKRNAWLEDAEARQAKEIEQHLNKIEELKETLYQNGKEYHPHMSGMQKEIDRLEAKLSAASSYAEGVPSDPNNTYQTLVRIGILQDPITATNILSRAAGHMQDRAKTYDAPQGERSMGKTVVAFNALYAAGLTEEQGWAFMALLKLVRASQGAYRADNYEDGAAYFALMGEAAARGGERG